ncbi:unnamed protein product [Schistosoma bovis]|nr:unnamed protein product [Schistosoma bovis]
MSFNCRNADLAFPILSFTSKPDPPHSSMMLCIYVNVSACSRASLLSVIGLVFFVLYLRILFSSFAYVDAYFCSLRCPMGSVGLAYSRVPRSVLSIFPSALES